MGLDNGITARVTHNDTEIQDFDVCYWRKCWSLRTSILSKIGYDRDDKETTINLTDIYDVIGKELKSNYHDSIWDSKLLIRKYKKDKRNLRKLIFMHKHFNPDKIYKWLYKHMGDKEDYNESGVFSIEYIFYDSY